MPELLWVQFEYDRGRQLLRNVLSGQAIELVDERADQCRFNYRDAEIEASFIARRDPRSWGVDFNETAAKESYGLWRRMAFGLPDLLAFWLLGGRSAFDRARSRITLEGGWQNGRWAPSSMITADLGNPYDPNSLTRPTPPKSSLALFPLAGLPSAWRYVDVRDIAPEIELATVPGNGLPLLDLTQSLDMQLTRAPRFVRADGRATLFHRYIGLSFHRDDYYLHPHYGYVNERVALTFDASPSFGAWLCSRPLLASEEILPENHFDDLQTSRWGTSATPALGLREELFFALFDICAVRQEIAIGGGLPKIQVRDLEAAESEGRAYPDYNASWNEIRFAQYLDTIKDFPMRTPHDRASVSFSAVLPTSFDIAPSRRGARIVPDWLRGVFRGGRR